MIALRRAGLAIALALVASAPGCGSDGEPSSSGEPPTEAPSAQEFPAPKADSIDEFIADVGQTNEVVAAPAGGVYEPGKGRFGFALFDVAGPQIDDADVALYFQPVSGEGKVEGPYPARAESLEVQSAYRADGALDGDVTSVYVADVPLDPGKQRAVAVVRDSDGDLAATNFQTAISVKEQRRIPAVGDRVPSVHTPTLDDVDDVAEIDTRVPPSTMHSEDLADVLGEKPVVLLFATPALCQSRVCGPVVDVAEQVKSEYGDEAAFIHMEIWENNEFDPKKPNPRPQVEEFGLFTEPWLFVLDKEGRVAARIEGAFSVSELESALDKVIG